MGLRTSKTDEWNISIERAPGNSFHLKKLFMAAGEALLSWSAGEKKVLPPILRWGSVEGENKVVSDVLNRGRQCRSAKHQNAERGKVEKEKKPASMDSIRGKRVTEQKMRRMGEAALH